MKKTMILFLALAVPTMVALTAHAADYVITLKDQTFTPSDLVIPAGEKVKITVKNADKRSAEFESHELKREKIIKAGGEAIITLGPLKPGIYPYFDEFNADKAKGTITVK